MADTITLGTWLRRERERRGVTLSQISEQTKLSVALLEGLEADDLSRWPGGIFRRAFTKSYATAIGLDPDLVVKRVEEAHPVKESDAVEIPTAVPAPLPSTRPTSTAAASTNVRSRLIAATLDLLVAGALGLGFAAAGSRLLWPVLAIAAYHAVGMMLTGRSPMLALLFEHEADAVVPALAAVPRVPQQEAEPSVAPVRLERTTASATRNSTRSHRQVSRRAARAARRA